MAIYSPSHSLTHTQTNQMSTTLPKYDVFLSFRGLDTRRNFISFLHRELFRRTIRAFKDDKDLEPGGIISPELKRAIKESRFAVVVISMNYAASSWCLKELVEIMDSFNNGSLTVMPVFYGVNPSHLKEQTEEVADQFKKHEEREDQEEVLLWRQALSSLVNISGGDCSSKWEDDSKLVDEICNKISNKLMTITKSTSIGTNSIAGVDAHMKAIYGLLDSSNKDIRVLAIWARGSNVRSALAKLVYQNMSNHFEHHCFVENLKKISQDRNISQLGKELSMKIKGEEHFNKSRLEEKKILVVANEVNNLEQFETLADKVYCFGRGSVFIVTTQDMIFLKSAGIDLVYEVEALRFQKVRKLIRQVAFRERDFSAAFEAAWYRLKNLAVEWSCCLRAKSGYRKI